MNGGGAGQGSTFWFKNHIFLLAPFSKWHFFPPAMLCYLFLCLYFPLLHSYYPFTFLFIFPNSSLIYLFSHIFSPIPYQLFPTTLVRGVYSLKGLSLEIFSPVFWPVRMNLGLNVNRLWF
jgi:hypothetical protein